VPKEVFDLFSSFDILTSELKEIDDNNERKDIAESDASHSIEFENVLSLTSLLMIFKCNSSIAY
jgi:hypothetical protein